MQSLITALYMRHTGTKKFVNGESDGSRLMMMSPSHDSWQVLSNFDMQFGSPFLGTPHFEDTGSFPAELCGCLGRQRYVDSKCLWTQHFINLPLHALMMMRRRKRSSINEVMRGVFMLKVSCS